MVGKVKRDLVVAQTAVTRVAKVIESEKLPARGPKLCVSGSVIASKLTLRSNFGPGSPDAPPMLMAV